MSAWVSRRESCGRVNIGDFNQPPDLVMSPYPATVLPLRTSNPSKNLMLCRSTEENNEATVYLYFLVVTLYYACAPLRHPAFSSGSCYHNLYNTNSTRPFSSANP
jgi:hypothetical protein